MVTTNMTSLCCPGFSGSKSSCLFPTFCPRKRRVTLNIKLYDRHVFPTKSAVVTFLACHLLWSHQVGTKHSNSWACEEHSHLNMTVCSPPYLKSRLWMANHDPHSSVFESFLIFIFLLIPIAVCVFIYLKYWTSPMSTALTKRCV